MPKRLTEELKDAVVADYLAGVTTRDIKKKYKTYELYSILKEREIEYKQNNKKQEERYNQVIELYLKGEKIETIEEITGCKFVYRVLKKFNISRKRNPKEYNTHKKEERNIEIVKYYQNGIDIKEIAKKYNVSKTNIIRILKLYGIEYERKTNHKGNSSTIIAKIKQNPNMKCKFYILEDYCGYTKIGITTKNQVKERYNKEVKVFYVLEDTIKNCYDLEYKLKKTLKTYNPNNIDKNIDGWTECYTLSPQEIISLI
jgi:transposase